MYVISGYREGTTEELFITGEGGVYSPFVGFTYYLKFATMFESIERAQKFWYDYQKIVLVRLEDTKITDLAIREVKLIECEKLKVLSR